MFPESPLWKYTFPLPPTQVYDSGLLHPTYTSKLRRQTHRSCLWCRKSNNWHFHPVCSIERCQWGWLRESRGNVLPHQCYALCEGSEKTLEHYPPQLKQLLANLFPATIKPCMQPLWAYHFPFAPQRVVLQPFLKPLHWGCFSGSFMLLQFSLFSIKGGGSWINDSPQLSLEISALIRKPLKLVRLSSVVFNKCWSRIRRKNAK